MIQKFDNHLSITVIFYRKSPICYLLLYYYIYFFNFDDVINTNTVYFCLILPTAPSRSQSPRFPTPRRSARTQEARMRQRRRLS